MNRKVFIFAIALAALGAGAHAQQALPGERAFLIQVQNTQAAVEEAQGAVKLFPKDIQYSRSVEFAAICVAIYRAAWKSLSADAQEHTGRWAIVLDVDETVMDNFQYQLESNSHFDSKTWDAWIRRMSAGAVPGAKEFLDKVRALPGGRVVFITDRKTDQEQSTVENMRRLGLFKEGDQILTKAGKEDNKEVRRLCVEKAEDARCAQYGPTPILALFGDSARDFVEYYGDEMKVKGREDILAHSGVRFWPLPNSMYGQWERNYK